MLASLWLSKIPPELLRQGPALERDLERLWEKASTRALTGPTSSVGPVFLCIFNAARPVGTILNGHGNADLFLDPSRGPAFDVGQPGVASTLLWWLAAGRVLGFGAERRR